MANLHENLLSGKTVVVTGSSSGIGRATALRLATAGANVLVHAARNRTGAEETARQIRELGRSATIVLADLAQPAEQDKLIAAARQWQPRIDVWVNNAGVDVLTGENATLSFEDKLKLLWQVDVAATMRLSRIVGQQMLEQKAGAIINIGWDQVEHGMAGDSGELFAAVKGAVMAFTRSLARTLAPHVRVNAVAPGWIKTAWGDGASDAWQQRAKREALLDRWGTPDDVADAILYLASPLSAFITGQILAVNGGFRGTAE